MAREGPYRVRVGSCNGWEVAFYGGVSHPSCAAAREACCMLCYVCRQQLTTFDSLMTSSWCTCRAPRRTRPKQTVRKGRGTKVSFLARCDHDKEEMRLASETYAYPAMSYQMTLRRPPNKVVAVERRRRRPPALATCRHRQPQRMTRSHSTRPVHVQISVELGRRPHETQPHFSRTR